jgi:EmrB/QacA subfamily drug resistance transporter
MSPSWKVLALLCAAQFMVVLDASIVNVALPSMNSSLGFAAGDLQWVVSAYALAFGGLLLLGGRIGDAYGRRRAFLIGLSAFTLASLIGGFATEPWMLIAARAAQGATAALVAPAVLSLITTGFPEGAVRNRALSVFGAVAAGGFAAGVLLGGVLTEYLGWRWVLFVNVPIGISLVAAAIPVLTPDAARESGAGLDWLGAALVTSAVALVVYALSTAAEPTASMATIVGVGALGAALLVGFLKWERSAAQPLLPPAFLRGRSVALANLVGLLFGAAMGPLLYVLTLHLQGTLGLSAVQTGLVFLPHALVVAVAAGPVSRLVTKHGYAPVVVGGTILLLAGALWLAVLPATGGLASVIIPATLLSGLGVCAMIVGATVAATDGVADQEQGLASGLFNTAQQLGVAIGLAAAVLAAASAPDLIGHRRSLLVCAAFAAAALIVALRLARSASVDRRLLKAA